jgi:Astacin (Peptidase family M12A).
MKKKCFLNLFIPFLLASCSSNEIENPLENEAKNRAIDNSEFVTLMSGAIVEKWNDSYLYLGDILLSDEQFELLDETGSIFHSTENKELHQVNDENIIPIYPETGMSNYYLTTSTSKAVGKHPYQNMFWSMLRFTFHRDLTNSQRQSILSAMAYMESLTNIRFYNATGEPTRDTQYGFDYPYVEFTPSNRNNSYVGRIGGKQILNLFNFDRGTITHEICHALGMFHEQSRVDRDNYVTINYNNIHPDNQHNFRKETANYYMIGNFDFNSIMLYGPYDFSIDYSKPTITKKNGSTYVQNRSSLSDLDRRFINTFYLPYIARKDVLS